MVYVQRKGGRYLETVDEFDTWKEARAMVVEYRMADPSASHYLSSRPCKGWNAPKLTPADAGHPDNVIL